MFIWFSYIDFTIVVFTFKVYIFFDIRQFNILIDRFTRHFEALSEDPELTNIIYMKCSCAACACLLLLLSCVCGRARPPAGTGGSAATHLEFYYTIQYMSVYSIQYREYTTAVCVCDTQRTVQLPVEVVRVLYRYRIHY